MMKPTIIHYMIKGCPVCARTKPMLRLMEIDGIINVIDVDTEATVSGDLMDRYKFFIRRVLGGSREVPVILMNNRLWFMPKRRSKVGGVSTSFSDILDKSISDLQRKILVEIKNIKKRPEPVPTHGQLVERLVNG